MANDHSIELLITANLNIGASIGNINAAIRALAKHPSLKSLDLKVDVDKSFVKSMNSFVEATKKLSVALEAQNKVVHEEIETFKRLDGTIEKVTKQRLENGDIITKSNKKVDESKKKIQEEIDAYNKQKKTLQELEAELIGFQKTKTAVNKNDKDQITGYSNTYKNNATGQTVVARTDADGAVKGYKQTTDSVKAYNDALKREQSVYDNYVNQLKQNFEREKDITTQRERVHAETLRTQNALNSAQQQAQNKQIAAEKQHYMALQENAKRDQQYAKSVADLSANIEKAKTRFANNAGLVQGLSNLDTQLKNVSGSFSSRVSAVNGLNEEFKRLTTGVQGAHRGVKLFGDGMGAAIANMVKFQIAIAAVYAPLTALRDIFSTVINVDAQMTQLKRVMDDATDFNKILQDNIRIANELGRSIEDVGENSIGFARMGFDSAQTENLSKVATLFQNISDLTPKEAIDTLTASMTVFNIEASNSIQIADKLNEVDNNFGASCSDITALREIQELISLTLLLIAGMTKPCFLKLQH